MSQKFFCDNCGEKVNKDEFRCPRCGRYFRSVKCPACGFSGSAGLFTDGCPACGYAEEGGGGGEHVYYESQPPKKSDRLFSGKFYRRAIPILAALVLFLLIMLLRLLGS